MTRFRSGAFVLVVSVGMVLLAGCGGSGGNRIVSNSPEVSSGNSPTVDGAAVFKEQPRAMEGGFEEVRGIYVSGAAMTPPAAQFVALSSLGNLFAGTTITPLPKHSGAKWSLGRKFDKVMIIVLENQDYDTVMRNSYMKSLAAKGTLFTEFNGNFHPSYANYLAMVGGRYFHTTGDKQKDIDAKTIADLLEAKGLTWKQFAEDFPGNCFKGSKSGRYQRKHVPFMSFKNIQNNPDRCANVQEARFLDKKHIASYTFYSPNMDNDGHDTGLRYAAKWLQKFLDPLLADTEFMMGQLVVVTFDESATPGDFNHIYTVFLGPMVKAGARIATPCTHYNVLRTIEDNFAIGTLGGEDKKADPILEAWQ